MNDNYTVRGNGETYKFNDCAVLVKDGAILILTELSLKSKILGAFSVLTYSVYKTD